MTRAAPEFQLQCAVIELLRFCRRAGVVFLHPANGEARSKRTGGRLKAMGVLPGASDIHLTLPPNGRAAWLELKAPGGSLSPAQRAFGDAVLRAGALYAVAKSVAEAEAILTEWGAISRTRAGRQATWIETPIPQAAE